jgi:hypothetical protein
MFIVTKSKSEKEVGKALELLIEEINSELEMTDGLISGIDCEITVGPLETSVSASVFIDGDEPRRKFLIGVNEKGYNREHSMKKAEKRANVFLKDGGGAIAGSFVKTISILPERVYTTLIIAVNGSSINDVMGLDTKVRRKRIKKGLELLGDDPSVLNIANLAKIFGISRTMIYKDLEIIGYKRS